MKYKSRGVWRKGTVNKALAFDLFWSRIDPVNRPQLTALLSFWDCGSAIPKSLLYVWLCDQLYWGSESVNVLFDFYVYNNK